MALGQLVVRLGLDAAEFTAGLTRSELRAQRFGQNLERNLAAAGRAAAIGLQAAAVAAAAAALAIDKLSKDAGQFKDLEERIGSSAERIASLAVAAGTAGLGMSELEQISVRLTKGISGLDEESKGAVAALTAIGIPIEDLKRLDPIGQLEAIARALAGFEDGAAKTAVAVALFGRAGAQALPFLRELAGETGRQTILTQAQIEAADRYADSQAKATAQLKLYAQAAATDALPAIAALTTTVGAFIRALTGVDDAAAALGRGGLVKTFAEGVVRYLGAAVTTAQLLARTFEATGTALGGLEAAKQRVLRGDIAGARAIIAELKTDLAEIANRPLFSTTLEQQLKNSTFPDIPERRDSAPRGELKFNQAGIKAGVDSAKRELQSLQDFIDRLNQQGRANEFGVSDTTVANFDQLGEALRRNIISIEEYNRLIDVILDNEPSFQQQQREKNRLYEEFVEVQRRAIETSEDFLQGMRDEAAALGLSREALAEFNVELRRREALKGVTDPTAISRVNAAFDEAAALARTTVARDLANQATQRGIETGLGIVQRYNEELGALGKTGLALEEYRLELERTAALVGVTDEAQRNYINSLFDTAKALAANVDAQRRFVDDAIQLNDSFRGSFADNIAAVADGSRSFKDAVKSMADDWVRALNRMAANKLADALFGGQGSTGSGIFGDLGKLFSGLFNFGGGGGGSADPFGIGGWANGGYMAANQPGWVGERGPEIFVPKVAGTIVPNNEVGKTFGDRNVTVVNNNNFAAGMSTSSIAQAATLVGLRTQRAVARNT